MKWCTTIAKLKRKTKGGKCKKWQLEMKTAEVKL